MRIAAVVFAAGLLGGPCAALTVKEIPPFVDDATVSGGRVHAIAIHPVLPQLIVVSHELGGLARSEDFGITWKRLIALDSVRTMDVAWSKDGETLIATTSKDGDTPGGIWISRIRGDGWSRAPLTLNAARGISFAPEGNRVYVATDRGVAVGTDDGDAWEWRWELPGFDLYSVLAHGERVLTAGHEGLFLKDKGDWRRVAEGEFAFNDRFKTLDGFAFFSGTAFVLRDGATPTVGVFDMAFRGFTRLFELPPQPRGRGGFVRVAVRGEEEETFDLWVGLGATLLRIGGVHDLLDLRTLPSEWIVEGDGVRGDPGDLAIDVKRRAALYGSDGGLYRSIGDSKWQRVSTAESRLNSLQITGVAATDDGSNARVYITTVSNGIWVSDDGGDSWLPTSGGADGYFLRAPARALFGEPVTIAYGRADLDQASWFAGERLDNQRPIPRKVTGGGETSGLTEAFPLAPRQWARLGFDVGRLSELWVSEDDGETWRLRARVEPLFGNVGRELQIAYAGPRPVAYAAFVRLAEERVGLMVLDHPLAASITNLTRADLLFLPEGGSIGQVEYSSWGQPLYAVDPRDPAFVIAADVKNLVMRITSDGGRTWPARATLTSAVGNVRNVTVIAFDPHRPGRIIVGTHDRGVFLSEDHGETWNRITGTEPVSDVTGFAFSARGAIYVSSLGRGLWRIEPELDLRIVLTCRGCIHRYRFDPGEVGPPPDPASWTNRGLFAVYNGTITGLQIVGGRIRGVSISPGAKFVQYAPSQSAHDVPVTVSSKGIGYRGVQRPWRFLWWRRVLTAVALEDDRVVAVYARNRPFRESEVKSGIETRAVGRH